MCVEGGFFFKINKRDFTFIREMRRMICVPHFSGPDTQGSHQFFMPMSGRTARFIWPELQSQYIEYTGKKYRTNMFEQRERCILLQQHNVSSVVEF